MLRNGCFFTFVIVLVLVSLPAAAADIRMTPSTRMTREQEIRRSTPAASKALQSVHGWGDRLRISYTATTDVDLDLAPLHRSGSVDPVELVYATLPAGKWSAVVDLTASVGWSLLPQEYVLQFSVPSASQRIEVLSVEFLPPEFSSIARAAWRGLLRREQFLVSTPHAIRGNVLAGIPLVLLIGIATVFGTLVMRRKSGTAAVGVLTGGLLLMHLWFGIDLARFTAMHLREWSVSGTVGDVGAAEDVGSALREIAAGAERPPFVYVCGTAGNYYPKAVRSFAYPVPVSTLTADIPRVTHVLAASSAEPTGNDGILNCGDLSGKAEKLRTFADGSILYSPVP